VIMNSDRRQPEEDKPGADDLRKSPMFDSSSLLNVDYWTQYARLLFKLKEGAGWPEITSESATKGDLIRTYQDYFRDNPESGVIIDENKRGVSRLNQIAESVNRELRKGELTEARFRIYAKKASSEIFHERKAMKASQPQRTISTEGQADKRGRPDGDYINTVYILAQSISEGQRSWESALELFEKRTDGGKKPLVPTYQEHFLQSSHISLERAEVTDANRDSIEEINEIAQEVNRSYAENRLTQKQFINAARRVQELLKGT